MPLSFQVSRTPCVHLSEKFHTTEHLFFIKLPEIPAETTVAPSGGVSLTGPQVPALIRSRSEETRDRTPLAVQWLGPRLHCRGHGFDPWLGN